MGYLGELENVTDREEGNGRKRRVKKGTHSKGEKVKGKRVIDKGKELLGRLG